MDTIAYEAHVADTVAAAEAVLAQAFGLPCRCAVAQDFRGPKSRSTVLRLRVLDSGGHAPASVIAKRFGGSRGEPYDPTDDAAQGSRARLLNEWAGARFLQEATPGHAFVPAVYGGDGAIGLVVLEDLGEGECLADLLQAADAGRATRGLLAYATTLGRLHAATAGRREAYWQVRAELAAGSGQPPQWEPMANWPADGMTPFRQACAALELPITAAVEGELARAAAIVAAPGPFDAYSVSDTCPDNHRYEGATDADAGTLRFFDMEFGGFRHALLDAAYVWLPFPTCWCVNRLPADLPPRLEAAYRAELTAGCPEAGDDDRFGQALVAAAAIWWASTTAWQIIPALDKEDRWGIATLRQRFPLRAANFAALAGRWRQFPALGVLAETFAARLHARWGDEAAMPLYAAFR